MNLKSLNDMIDMNLVDEENQTDAIEGDCWRKYARKLKSWLHPYMILIVDWLGNSISSLEYIFDPFDLRWQEGHGRPSEVEYDDRLEEGDFFVEWE